jgi:hypothetical protein
MTYRPFEEEYTKLLTDFSNSKKHNYELCVRYLDIACLARRFGMFKLEEWATNSLHDIFTKSIPKLVEYSWDKTTILRLRSFTQHNKLRSSVMNFLQYFISVSVKEAVEGDATASSNYDTCVQLYKDPVFLDNDPALFGCVFASILSLGHRSFTWTSNLTRNDRRILYAAQVQLVKVSSELQSLDWLLQPASRLASFQTLCDYCRQKLWDSSFGQCGDLNSDTPLKDMSSLARLPQYRQLLVKEWEADRAKTWFNLLKSQPTSSSTPAKCKYPPCAVDILLLSIDEHIQKVYEEITHQYKRLATCVTLLSCFRVVD